MNWDKVRHFARALPTWVGHYLSNSWGILNVFDLAWLRPIPGGLVDASHPFATGISPESGELIWDENLLFSTERTSEHADSDSVIIHKVMKAVRGIFSLSTSSEKYPNGRSAAMPPGINLLHGPVHYNGASLLFNDTREAMRHFSDRRFVRELRRFIDTEKREIIVIFREREYDREDLALFTCFVRTVFPYWANPNGNKPRIHWGVPGPYPVVNLITGNWIRDTRMLLSESGREVVARPPIPRDAYFQEGPYDRGWENYMRPEKLLSAFTSWRVGLRGEQGGVYFFNMVERRAGVRFDPNELPTLFGRLKDKWQKRWLLPCEFAPRPTDASNETERGKE